MKKTFNRFILKITKTSVETTWQTIGESTIHKERLSHAELSDDLESNWLADEIITFKLKNDDKDINRDHSRDGQEDS